MRIHIVFSAAANVLERLVVSMNGSGLNRKVKVMYGALNTKHPYFPISEDSLQGQAKRSILDAAPAWLPICRPGRTLTWSIATFAKFANFEALVDFANFEALVDVVEGPMGTFTSLVALVNEVVTKYPANNPETTEVINKYVNLFLKLDIE